MEGILHISWHYDNVMCLIEFHGLEVEEENHFHPFQSPAHLSWFLKVHPPYYQCETGLKKEHKNSRINRHSSNIKVCRQITSYVGSSDSKFIWGYAHSVTLIKIFFCGVVGQHMPQPPHSWGFQIKHNDAPQLVELLWTSDQLIAETPTWQHTALTRERTSMPPAGFERTTPASKWPQTHTLDNEVQIFTVNWNNSFVFIIF